MNAASSPPGNIVSTAQLHLACNSAARSQSRARIARPSLAMEDGAQHTAPDQQASARSGQRRAIGYQSVSSGRIRKSFPTVRMSLSSAGPPTFFAATISGIFASWAYTALEILPLNENGLS